MTAINQHELPASADATQVDPVWHHSHDGRGFLGTTRPVDRAKFDKDPDAAIAVQVSGVQFVDGRIKRWVFIRGGESPMTPGETRQLARQLNAAANEIADLATRGR
jgi:hypothetical protein